MKPFGILFVLFWLFLPIVASAQTFRIDAYVKGLPDQKVFLASIRGDEVSVKDSVLSSGGHFGFNIHASSPKGLYRIILGDERLANFFDQEILFFDLIINNENIVLETELNNPAGAMNVLISDENKIYYRFLKERQSYIDRFSGLMQLGSLYDFSDSFYNHYLAELLRLQKSMADTILSLAGELPGSIAGSMVKLFLEPVYDPSDAIPYDAFMRGHYFDLIALSDPALINSNIYTHKVVNYLGFFRSPYASQLEQEEHFITAVDAIMQNVDYNQEVYDFILNYLIEGFERFKMEKVLVHIADFHLSGECETDNQKIMEQRLEAYQAMATGKKVNDFVLPDNFNKAHRLSEIESDYVLLVFWASWCPHCTQLLPRLKKWYNEEAITSGMEIITVSIDTSRFEWEEFLMLNELPWINLFEQLGWEGKVARQFNIYATPTMFLLDKQRKILAKPLTFREFKQEVDKLQKSEK